MSTIRESGEDYLEAMLALEDENGEIRSVDVANALGVTRPSVNKAVASLKEAGMVEQEPYGNIVLTNEGRKVAKRVSNSHEVIRSFLLNVIGTSYETADTEACRIEHVISRETFEGFKRLLINWQRENEVSVESRLID